MNTTYLKMITAPIWGLAFLMFLPAIGFVLTGVALVKWLVKPFQVPVPMAVGVANLTGPQHRPDGPSSHGHTTESCSLAAVEADLAAQRAAKSK